MSFELELINHDARSCFYYMLNNVYYAEIYLEYSNLRKLTYDLKRNIGFGNKPGLLYDTGVTINTSVFCDF